MYAKHVLLNTRKKCGICYLYLLHIFPLQFTKNQPSSKIKRNDRSQQRKKFTITSGIISMGMVKRFTGAPPKFQVAWMAQKLTYFCGRKTDLSQLKLLRDSNRNWEFRLCQLSKSFFYQPVTALELFVKWLIPLPWRTLCCTLALMRVCKKLRFCLSGCGNKGGTNSERDAMLHAIIGLDWMPAAQVVVVEVVVVCTVCLNKSPISCLPTFTATEHQLHLEWKVQACPWLLHQSTLFRGETWT